MFRALWGTISTVNRGPWFGTFGLTVAAALAGAVWVPPAHASTWTRVEYALLSAVVAFVVSLIVTVVLRIALSPVGQLFSVQRDVRLGQRSIEVGRRILHLFPWRDYVEWGIKERSDPAEFMGHLTTEEDNPKLVKMLQEHEQRAAFDFEQTLARDVFRVTTELHRLGYITDAERDEFRGRMASGIALLQCAVKLIHVGLRLGGRV